MATIIPYFTKINNYMDLDNYDITFFGTIIIEFSENKVVIKNG